MLGARIDVVECLIWHFNAYLLSLPDKNRRQLWLNEIKWVDWTEKWVACWNLNIYTSSWLVRDTEFVSTIHVRSESLNRREWLLLKKNKLTNFTASVSEVVRGHFLPPAKLRPQKNVTMFTNRKRVYSILSHYIPDKIWVLGQNQMGITDVGETIEM